MLLFFYIWLASNNAVYDDRELYLFCFLLAFILSLTGPWQCKEPPRASADMVLTYLTQNILVYQKNQMDADLAVNSLLMTQIMVCCLVVPSHSLSQYWLKIIGNHPRTVLQKMCIICWQNYHIWNKIFKYLYASFRGQWFDIFLSHATNWSEQNGLRLLFSQFYISANPMKSLLLAVPTLQEIKIILTDNEMRIHQQKSMKVSQ